MNSTIYFAHPVSDYDTLREEAHITEIKRKFDEIEILNPNAQCHEKNYKEAGMEYFEYLAATCNIIIASPFRNGEFGMGVYREIEACVRDGGVLYVVEEKVTYVKDALAYMKISIKEADLEDIRPLSITETRKQVEREKWESSRDI